MPLPDPRTLKTRRDYLDEIERLQQETSDLEAELAKMKREQAAQPKTGNPIIAGFRAGVRPTADDETAEAAIADLLTAASEGEQAFLDAKANRQAFLDSLDKKTREERGLDFHNPKH